MAGGPWCARVALKLRMFFSLLKSGKEQKNEAKRTHTHNKKRICDEDLIWPTEPKIFAASPLKKMFSDP